MFGLYAGMYEQKSQNTSNRIKETLKTRAKKGLFKGSVAPYGYDVKDSKLVIRNEENPEIVKEFSPSIWLEVNVIVLLNGYILRASGPLLM
jgi:DNA invertase Pin-like site-specific DNA recombinase